MRRHTDTRRRFAREIYVVHAIGFEVGRIRRHDQRIAFQLVANVHLVGDAIEYGRQGFVDCIQCDHTLDIGVDIDIQLGVTREGKQQLFRGHFGYDHVIGDRFGLYSGWRQMCGHLYRGGDGARHLGSGFFGNMALRLDDARFLRAAAKDDQGAD